MEVLTGLFLLFEDLVCLLIYILFFLFEDVDDDYEDADEQAEEGYQDLIDSGTLWSDFYFVPP